MSSLLLNIHNQRKLQFTFHRSLWHVNHTREAQRAELDNRYKTYLMDMYLPIKFPRRIQLVLFFRQCSLFCATWKGNS